MTTVEWTYTLVTSKPMQDTILAIGREYGQWRQHT
jgi:hypothetical protein